MLAVAILWIGHSYLLLHLPVTEDIFDSNVEFAHVIFAESISVPADALNEWNTHEGHVETDLPFRVEVLADGRCRLFRCAQVHNQVLQPSAFSSVAHYDRHTGSLVPFLSFAARFRACREGQFQGHLLTFCDSYPYYIYFEDQGLLRDIRYCALTADLSGGTRPLLEMLRVKVARGLLAAVLLAVG